jgi:hypothetical protein
MQEKVAIKKGQSLRRWLYRDTLSCEMCFIIALTLYKWTYHVNVKYHKSTVRNCHSENKHSISIGILIPSTTKLYMYILNHIIGLYKCKRKWLSRKDNQ